MHLFFNLGHAFFECGSLGNPTGRSMLKAFGEEWTCLQKIRATCGVGLAVRLGDVGRAELNYCFPLRYYEATGFFTPNFFPNFSPL